MALCVGCWPALPVGSLGSDVQQHKSQVWWWKTEIPALWRQRWEDKKFKVKFKVIFDYIVRLRLPWAA